MRIKSNWILAFVAAVSVMSPARSLCDQKPRTLYYEVKLTCPSGNLGMRKMYVKGDCFAWVSETKGILKPITLIKNKDGAFLIDPKGRWAGQYPKGSDRESPMVFLPGPTGDVKTFLTLQKAVKSGKEKVVAYGHKTPKLCDIYSYKEKTTGHTCKLWVDQKTTLPVKLVILTARRSDERTATYVAYKPGYPVDDSVFVVSDKLMVRPMPTLDRNAKPVHQTNRKPRPKPQIGYKSQPEQPGADTNSEPK